MEERPNAAPGEQPLAETLRRFDRVIELQREGMFLLTGFFVNAATVDLLRPVLGSDTPPVGARARYKRVPASTPQTATGSRTVS